MLGRHRVWFTQYIESVVGQKGIVWHDFDFSSGVSKNHGDTEIRGLNFLPAGDPARLGWNTWWPRKGNAQNWDAVGECRIDGATNYLLVEAKASINELQQSIGAKSGGGLELIKARLAETQEAMGVSPCDWTKTYYQYANRLALLHFLKERGVSAHLIFVYFNGDTNPKATCPGNIDAWRPKLSQMKKCLGLTGHSALEQRIHEVFVPVVED